MRKYYFLLSISLLMAITTFGQSVPELLYYKFDTGTTISNDASTPVGTNPATFSGSTFTVGGLGLSGTALQGTGASSTTDFVNTGWATNLSGSWTIGFWTKDIVPSATLWYIFGDNSAGSFRCFTNGAAGANNWRLTATGLPTIQANGGATTAPTFTHFVYDAAANEMRSYVNGVLSQSLPVTGTPTFSGTQFKIGGYGSNSGLNGLMDEFRIYNRALTVTEILATINGPIGVTPCSSAVAGTAVASATISCPGATVNLLSQGATLGVGTTYQWQQSADSINFTNIAGATNLGYPANPATTTYYRLIVGCGTASDTSNIVAVRILSTPLSPGVYTINAALPASSTNFQTLTAALEQINCAGITGAVTLSLAPGTYTGSYTIGNYNGNSNALTITSSTGVVSDVVFTNAGTTNVFNIDGANNVTISTITINTPAAPTAASAGINVNNASNIVITGTNISGFPGNTSSNNRAIYANNTQGLVVIGNQLSNAYYGIYHVGTASPGYSNGNQYVANTITNCYYYGIYLTNHQASLVDGNTISDFQSNTSAQHMYLLRNREMTITNNKMLGSVGIYGIYMSNMSMPATAGAQNLIANNVISGDFSSTTPRAIYLVASATDSVDQVTIAHNSIELRSNTTSTTANGVIFLTGGTATAPAVAVGGFRMYNNAIRAVRQTTATNFAGLYISADHLNDKVAASHNLYNIDVTNPAGDIRVAAINYTLAAWLTLTGQEASSINGNPLYTSATDLTPLAVSPLKDAGTPLAYVTSDIAGFARGSSPDMGAYEIQLVAGDLLMVDITSPPAVVTGGTPYPVTIRFKNVGTDTLRTATVAYQFGANAPVTAAFAGVVAPFDTATYTFTANLTVPVGVSGVLTAYTSGPNGAVDPTPANDTFSMVLCQPIVGGTYTVGSPTSNFPSLSDLVDVLNCGGVSGPVTFLFDGPNNVISEQLSLGNIPGTSATNIITFNGQGDTIRTAGSTGSSQVIVLDGSKHIRIRNMYVDANTANVGILLKDVEDIRIASNTVVVNPTATSTATSAIAISGSLTSVTTATTANNVRIDSNLVMGGYYTISMAGAAGTPVTNIEVTNNRVIDSYIYSIYTLQAHDVLIENNEIARPNRVTITTFYGIYNSTGARGIKVSKNRIHTTSGPAASSTSYAVYGIYFTGAAGDSLAPNVVSNNLIYNINTLTGSIYGVYITGGAHVYVLHNTSVYDYALSTAGLVYANYFLGTGSGHRFQNNLVYVSRGGSGTKYCLYISGATNVPISNNNVLTMLSTAGTNGVGYYTTGYTTLANWQTANNNAFDQNSVSADPVFVNPAAFNFTPSDFQVNNIGTNYSALVPTDINGVVRLASPDPGAIEFSPASRDAGITSMTININGVQQPIPSGCLPTLTSPLTITVANGGLDTLSNVAVRLKVNSSAVVSETVAGPILPGANLNHTFAAPIALTNGIDTVTSWIQLTGDGNANNDTFRSIANNFLTTIYQVPVYHNFDNGGLPAAACTNVGASAKVEVRDTTGTTSLAIAGSHSLVFSGSNAGTPWATPTDLNWTTLNPSANASLTYYVNASSLQRLEVSFKLLQLFRSTAVSGGFQLLANDQPIAPRGYSSPILRAANAAASTDTLDLSYDLDAFVGDTVKITLFSNVRWDYTGSPLHANIVDELRIFQPTGVAFDSVTVIGNTCTAGPKPVAAFARSATPVTAANLKFARNASATQSLAMTLNATNNSWNAILPASAVGDSVTYWVEATNTAGITASDTIRFDEVYLAFSAGNDTTITAGDTATLRANITGGSAADSLFSGVANNGSGAVMFEVMANKNVRIHAMDFYFTGTSTISIYVKNGTFVGFESNSAAWTLLNTISVTGAGTTTAVRANLPVPIELTANQMKGIYIFGSGVRYIGLAATPATIGQVWQTNGTLTLYGGIGGGALFSGGSNPGRTFAGHLYYTGADSLAWTSGATFLGNADTLRVAPASTTTYYATRFADNCSYTDTVTVFVNPAVSDDIGVTQILEPNMQLVQLNQPYQVKAVIRNFGNSPVTGFDVAYRVGAIELNANAINRTVAPGDTIHHIFTQTWTPTVGGQQSLCAYTKLVSDINNANDTTCVTSLQVSVGELAAGLSKVYPNPSSDWVQFEFSEPVSAGTRLLVLDAAGKEVARIMPEVGVQSIRFETHRLAAGAYQYRLEREKGVGVGKLMIVR